MIEYFYMNGLGTVYKGTHNCIYAHFLKRSGKRYHDAFRTVKAEATAN